MLPALAPGDFLLLDPTVRRWPRRGTVVVFHEPGSGILAIKRVAARGGDDVATPAGPLRLDPDEAWLLGDSPGPSIDSLAYGPVTVDRLVARAWLRYWPWSRIGRVGRADRPRTVTRR
jgi:hypothetical protein